MEQTNGRDEIEEAQQNVMEKKIGSSFFKSVPLPFLCQLLPIVNLFGLPQSIHTTNNTIMVKSH